MRVFAFILLAVIAYQTPQTGTENSGKNETSDPSRHTQTSGKQPDNSSTLKQLNCAEACQQDGQRAAPAAADPTRPWPDYVNAVSTAIIAFFTICLFVGVWVQIRTSRNIERAWVMVDISCDPGAEIVNTSGDGTVSTGLMGTKIKCRNTGNSPGWITEKNIKLAILRRPLPKHLSLDEPLTVITDLEPLSPGEPVEEKLDLVANGRHQRPEVSATIVYGRVIYRDIFNKNRETWFCYELKGWHSSRGLARMREYPEYNRHT